MIYYVCHQTVECYDPYISSFVHFCPTTNVIFSDFNSKPLDYPHTLLSLRTNTVAFHRICPFVAANNLVNPYLRYSCTYSTLSQLHNWFSSTLCFPYSKISTLIDPPHYAFARTLGIQYVADFSYFSYIHSNSLKAKVSRLTAI